jgi:hypothetical protein
MNCNIDAKGKAARLVSGLVCIAAGFLLALLAVVGFTRFWLSMGSGLTLAAFGAFQVFEAWAGWCIMRALGFKTRM